MDDLRIRATERHVAGYWDSRALWGSPGGDALAEAERCLSAPHVTGDLLAFCIAFPLATHIAALRARLERISR